MHRNARARHWHAIRGSASYSSIPPGESQRSTPWRSVHFLFFLPSIPPAPSPPVRAVFPRSNSPPQWPSPNPESPSSGREPARPAQSSCQETPQTIQTRRHPEHPSRGACECVYSQDEQPAGLFGQSQQDEQTHYEVKKQQQHIRQPPVMKENT